jgi:hypothetical protein
MAIRTNSMPSADAAPEHTDTGRVNSAHLASFLTPGGSDHKPAASFPRSPASFVLGVVVPCAGRTTPSALLQGSPGIYTLVPGAVLLRTKGEVDA